MPFAKGHKGFKPVGAKTKTKIHHSDLMIERLMLCFVNDQYYVYEHYYGDELFYIGKGKAGMAWEKDINARNKNWQTFVEAINYDYEIRIVCAGLSEEEALAIERVLIKSKQPKCNVVYLSDAQQICLFENINNG